MTSITYREKVPYPEPAPRRCACGAQAMVYYCNGNRKCERCANEYELQKQQRKERRERRRSGG